jgi:hypothetical protein
MASYTLLTTSNAKIVKSLKQGYQSYILHLSPYKVSGKNLCPKASAGCIASCLNYAGHGGMLRDGTNKVQEARKRKSRYFIEDQRMFMLELYVEISRAVKESASLGLAPVIRLNGTSDIAWERIPVLEYANIFEAYPSVQFYDYTKIEKRFKVCKGISNYHLTYSRTESNWGACVGLLKSGHSVAVVFDVLPSEYAGYKVIDGTVDDLRFLDPRSVIVGLKALGRAKKDVSGFVVREQ